MFVQQKNSKIKGENSYFNSFDKSCIIYFSRVDRLLNAQLTLFMNQ